jgi:gamma-glutamyltranspeptidase/glutathione hydrolase
VAGGHPLSVEAGLRLLHKGGNAVDAGVATLLAASVIEFSHFGLGGEVPILIKLRDGNVVVISGLGTAPLAATREFFLKRAEQGGAAKEVPTIRENTAVGKIPSTGPLAALVPGVLDAAVVALDRYGTMSLAEVMQPAIELADGFPIDEMRVRYIKQFQDTLSQWPASVRVFLPHGKAPEVGDVFVQADLARTLREIVAEEQKNASRGRHEGLMAARDYFYHGPIAQRIAASVKQVGGLLAEEDLARFHANVEEPVKTTYRGYEIYKAGFWTQGPAMIETLNLLEGFDLKRTGHNSADYIHTLTESLKLAFADRDRYYGDPAFSKIPSQPLLSKEYAALRRSLIDAEHASLEQRSGDPWNMAALAPAATRPASNSAESSSKQNPLDTTCVNVIDQHGNLFSATPSGAWLPSVIAGDTGIPLSQRMQSFVLDEGHPNLLQPGKRPRITLTPTIVLKDGQPFLALSTPGGDDQDQALLQVLLNIIEFGMSVQQAVEAPRFDTRHLMSSFDAHEFTPGALGVEGRVPEPVIQKLNARGHKITVRGDWGTPSAVTVISFDPKSGVISAGADPRRGRYAVAW